MTYTRWGRSSCPNNTDAQLVYSGRAGGTYYGSRGGSADKSCLPDDPDYIPGSPDLGSSLLKSAVTGAEYETHDVPQLTNLIDHNAPCAVCFVPTRSTTIMVPAKTTCPPSWTREYYGYLMSEEEHHYRTSYFCLDIIPEVIPGTASNVNPSLFYPTVTNCNGLACPPYVNNHMLSCVVCTK